MSTNNKVATTTAASVSVNNSAEKNTSVGAARAAAKAIAVEPPSFREALAQTIAMKMPAKN